MATRQIAPQGLKAIARRSRHVAEQPRVVQLNELSAGKLGEGSDRPFGTSLSRKIASANLPL
jgi:hypothetical protein